MVSNIVGNAPTDCGMPSGFVISDILNLDGGQSAGFKLGVGSNTYADSGMGTGSNGQPKFRNVPVTLSFVNTNIHYFTPQSDGDIKDGDIIKMQNASSSSGSTWLDGQTIWGAVALAPNTNAPYSGTHWRVHKLSNGNYAFANLGNYMNPDFVWLSGTPSAGTIALAESNTSSATQWTLTKQTDGSFSIQNAAATSGKIWLSGNTSAGDVDLVSSSGSLPASAQWQLLVEQ